MGKLALVLGGARSGKSALAEELLSSCRNVVYVATATAGDEEMAERIRIHRARRPPHWATIESPLDVEAVFEQLAPEVDGVIVDCITLYVTNLLLNNAHAGEEGILKKLELLCAAAGAFEGLAVLVSNEVGMGIVPDNELSRQFRDACGRGNQLLARSADEVHFAIAGLRWRFK